MYWLKIKSITGPFNGEYNVAYEFSKDMEPPMESGVTQYEPRATNADTWSKRELLDHAIFALRMKIKYKHGIAKDISVEALESNVHTSTTVTQTTTSVSKERLYEVYKLPEPVFGVEYAIVKHDTPYLTKKQAQEELFN